MELTEYIRLVRAERAAYERFTALKDSYWSGSPAREYFNIPPEREAQTRTEQYREMESAGAEWISCMNASREAWDSAERLLDTERSAESER